MTILCKKLSKITNKEIDAIEATVEFKFGDGTVINHQMFWGENGEIFPGKENLNFDDLIGNLYNLPTKVWMSDLKSDFIFVTNCPEIKSKIEDEMVNEQTCTNQDIIKQYINDIKQGVLTKKPKI